MRPERAAQIRFASTAAIRDEIARAIPLYAGIETLASAGDQVQWGGARLFADGRFAHAGRQGALLGGRAAAAAARREGRFPVSTRRGKQFNSMVQRERDPLTGAPRETC